MNHDTIRTQTLLSHIVVKVLYNNPLLIPYSVNTTLTVKHADECVNLV